MASTLETVLLPNPAVVSCERHQEPLPPGCVQGRAWSHPGKALGVLCVHTATAQAPIPLVSSPVRSISITSLRHCEGPTTRAHCGHLQCLSVRCTSRRAGRNCQVNTAGEGMPCPPLPAPCPLGGESPASLRHQLPPTPPPGIASRRTHPEEAGSGVVRGEVERWGLGTGLTSPAPRVMRTHPVHSALGSRPQPSC